MGIFHFRFVVPFVLIGAPVDFQTFEHRTLDIPEQKRRIGGLHSPVPVFVQIWCGTFPVIVQPDIGEPQAGDFSAEIAKNLAGQFRFAANMPEIDIPDTGFDVPSPRWFYQRARKADLERTHQVGPDIFKGDVFHIHAAVGAETGSEFDPFTDVESGTVEDQIGKQAVPDESVSDAQPDGIGEGCGHSDL